MSEPRCCAEVYDSRMWSKGPCGWRGKHWHEGRWYCRRHHPPSQTRKTTSAERSAQRIAAMSDMARKATCYDDLLAVVEEAIRLYGRPGGPWNVPSDPGGWMDRAQAAVAKARGGER